MDIPVSLCVAHQDKYQLNIRMIIYLANYQQINYCSTISELTEQGILSHRCSTELNAIAVKWQVKPESDADISDLFRTV